MKGKWRRCDGGYQFVVSKKDLFAVAYTGRNTSLNKSGFVLKVWNDPRTGKPWKSMKVAREWFDEVIMLSAVYKDGLDYAKSLRKVKPK